MKTDPLQYKFETMSDDELAEYIDEYNAWRRGDDNIEHPHVKELGVSLQHVSSRLRHIKEFEKIIEKLKEPANGMCCSVGLEAYESEDYDISPEYSMMKAFEAMVEFKLENTGLRPNKKETIYTLGSRSFNYLKILTSYFTNVETEVPNTLIGEVEAFILKYESLNNEESK